MIHKCFNNTSRLKGEIVERKEKCRLCGESSAKLISVVDYWDIRKTTIVKCEKCGLAQLDPMLSEEDTSKGCLAYYIEEFVRCSLYEQKRNMVRNFRRGVLFGYSLKKRNFNPLEILEFGPGSGYFLEGIKFVFPQTRITVMDINKEVLTFNKIHHQYKTFQSIPENHINELEGKFDLIIARDIIEHVMDISKVIENVKKYARSNGLFHFITPNGHEDLWKHYLTYNYLKKPSELLINHVNYFDGKGLLNYLLKNQFTTIEYYNCTLKSTFRGAGWKVKSKLMAPASQKKSADFYINERISEVKNVEFNKNDILNEWYIDDKKKYITYLMSWYHHAKPIRINPKYNIGHEIFGLFITPDKK
jgi:ubiquinone/menaquinone biosynthesis C-methylase UbiE